MLEKKDIIYNKLSCLSENYIQILSKKLVFNSKKHEFLEYF